MILEILTAGCLVWYFSVLTVCAIGIFQIRRNHVKATAPAVSTTFPLSQIPHVTIIRPVKGVEPYLYECLAATFHQTYPRDRLTIYFCISSRHDPAYPILERLLSDFPLFEANVLVEEEDPNLSGRNGRVGNLGPNPKIRNMSRAYREAKGDIVWIIDCNVWTGSEVAGRMVDHLCGFTTSAPGRKYKFVHQLPLVVDVSEFFTENVSLLSSAPMPSDQAPQPAFLPLTQSGGLLEELFLSTSHAKFYTAISTVAIAPCIVGKSNMFRRSHLNALTSPSPLSQHRDPGIDFFSDNICEDHLIGDLLWRSPISDRVLEIASQEGQDENERPRNLSILSPSENNWGNHALLPPHPSNLVTQPTSRSPLISYIDRRTRWLRVRKFTVTLATLVEPGTESLLCSAYGAFGLSTLPWCNRVLGIPHTWSAFCTVYLLSVISWSVMDRYLWNLLQYGGMSDNGRPSFGRTKGKRRGWRQWLLAWLGREVLAFPIWAWAVAGGVTVVWRGRKFWVGVDMRVHEIGEEGFDEANGPKRRID